MDSLPKTVWYNNLLCWVIGGIYCFEDGMKNKQLRLTVQIPNPEGLAWIIDLWPGEYQIIK